MRILDTLTPNKSCPYFSNVEPGNLVFLKTCNTDFDDFIIAFTGQNRRSLETENKINLSLLINKCK